MNFNFRFLFIFLGFQFHFFYKIFKIFGISHCGFCRGYASGILTKLAMKRILQNYPKTFSLINLDSPIRRHHVVIISHNWYDLLPYVRQWRTNGSGRFRWLGPSKVFFEYHLSRLWHDGYVFLNESVQYESVQSSPTKSKSKSILRQIRKLPCNLWMDPVIFPSKGAIGVTAPTGTLKT